MLFCIENQCFSASSILVHIFDTGGEFASLLGVLCIIIYISISFVNRHAYSLQYCCQTIAKTPLPCKCATDAHAVGIRYDLLRNVMQVPNSQHSEVGATRLSTHRTCGLQVTVQNPSHRKHRSHEVSLYVCPILPKDAVNSVSNGEGGKK